MDEAIRFRVTSLGFWPEVWVDISRLKFEYIHANTLEYRRNKMLYHKLNNNYDVVIFHVRLTNSDKMTVTIWIYFDKYYRYICA